MEDEKILPSDLPSHQQSFQAPHLSALKSFGLAPSSSSKRKSSSNIVDSQSGKRKRRASHVYKGVSSRGVPTMHNPDLYGHGKTGANTGLRRSFLATGVTGMRKSSVNKSSRKDKEEENNSIGTDYSDDDVKDMEYRQRNKDLYKTLRKIGVCVIPDPRIKTADNLPYFSIIQDDIREKENEKNVTRRETSREENSSKKKKTENRDFDVAHFKSIDFFSFLNTQAMMKNKRVRKSPALRKRHKNSKYAGIHLGEKEEKDVDEKINVIYMEGQEKLKESQHERQLMKLLESSGTGTRGLDQLPQDQDTMKMAVKGAKKRSILQVPGVLKNQYGDNSLLDRKFLGSDVAFDRGATGMQNDVNLRPEKAKMRNMVIEQLHLNKMEKKQKREKSLSKTMPLMMSKNKKLNSAYTKEKRKLEMEMLKLNEKLGTTAKILNLIRYDKSPTPIYKFKEYKAKIELMKKCKDPKKYKGISKKNLTSLISGKRGTRCQIDNSSNSSIIEDYEPPESDSDSF